MFHQLCIFILGVTFLTSLWIPTPFALCTFIHDRSNNPIEKNVFFLKIPNFEIFVNFSFSMYKMSPSYACLEGCSLPLELTSLEASTCVSSSLLKRGEVKLRLGWGSGSSCRVAEVMRFTWDELRVYLNLVKIWIDNQYIIIYLYMGFNDSHWIVMLLDNFIIFSKKLKWI